jgi:hypothetical protein
MKTNLVNSYLAVIVVSVLLSACVKDTDFNQADDIVISPVVELDLVHFDLPSIRFFDTIASTPVLTVRDTTDLRFLNDEEVRLNLKRAEFYFKFTNGIQHEFQIDFQFLTPQDDLIYVSQTQVSPGTSSNPVVTEYTDNIEGALLEQLTLAEKLVISVTIPSSNANLEGNIKLQSKATYYLEF